MIYFIAIVSIALSAIAQFFLKKGVQILELSSQNSFWINSKQVLTNWALLGGLGCYVASMIFWLFVLSKMEMSRAYPMVSLGYIMTLLIGHFFLGEPITSSKLIGVAIIVFGVIILTKA